jgi:secreted PhoX family phosphatase
MLTRRTRLACAAVAASGAVVTAAGSVTPASATNPLTIAAVTFTAPPGASLDDPQGVAATNGDVDVSNTADNVVASIAGATTTTVAGSYEGTGESGDGGPATAATLDNPTALARDKAGDLFIADTEDNVVREITSDGVIHLVAGDGTEGDRGDGGPATRAELDSPQGVAVNSQGDVFIADTYNDVVREVTPQGHISVYAGNGTTGYRGDYGPAARAELSSPTGLALDALGNLYIADSGNNVIRRVSTSGVITTVAGDVAADQASGGLGGFSGDGGPATSARLHSPQGIAVDHAGDLFIADTFNNAVREVTPGGTISTVVNTAGAKGSSGNGGPAASAKLNTPFDVAVDPSTADLYIADTSNNRVRVVTGFTVPTTTAGGPVAPAPPPRSHGHGHRP